MMVLAPWFSSTLVPPLDFTHESGDGVNLIDARVYVTEWSFDHQFPVKLYVEARSVQGPRDTSLVALGTGDGWFQ